MARNTENAVQPYRAGQDLSEGDFHVSEFAADYPGSHSPFGEDVQFPLDPYQLSYVHPGPAERPHLAGGR
jgi:hypothetical protein